jgi:hypothetical protein
MSGHSNNSFLNEFEPSEFYLSQNYPDPFKRKTVIKYCVAAKSLVRITIYDFEGREIEILVNEEKTPGTYEVEFDGSKDHSGKIRNLADGYYYYRMAAGDYHSEKKWLCKNHLIGRLSLKLFL